MIRSELVKIFNDQLKSYKLSDLLGINSEIAIKKKLFDVNTLDEFYDIFCMIDTIYKKYIGKRICNELKIRSYIHSFIMYNECLEDLILLIHASFYNLIIYSPVEIDGGKMDIGLKFANIVFYKKRNFLIKL